MQRFHMEEHRQNWLFHLLSEGLLTHPPIRPFIYLPAPQCKAACLPLAGGSFQIQPRPASSCVRGVPGIPPGTGYVFSDPSHRWFYSCTATQLDGFATSAPGRVMCSTFTYLLLPCRDYHRTNTVCVFSHTTNRANNSLVTCDYSQHIMSQHSSIIALWLQSNTSTAVKH